MTTICIRVCKLILCLILICSWRVSTTAAAERPDIGDALKIGRLKKAEAALTKHVADQPDDDLARFQLGTVQFFAAVQGLAQDSYHLGLRPPREAIMFLRMPVKQNPHPAQVSYQDVRAMIQRFVDGLNNAQATLEPVKDNQLSWKLDLTAVRIDTNGDGAVDDDETLFTLFQYFAARQNPAAAPESFPVGLDSADVQWLRGYCHLLAALGEAILAYNEQELFDRTAQLFFADPQSKFAAELVDKAPDEQAMNGRWSRDWILDAIAFVHLIHFPLHEADRLKTARTHLLAMVDCSRKSWKLIQAETDDDHEWIPGPTQHSVVPNVALTAERVATWHQFLNEADAVLNGKKLIPYWRQGSSKGVNMAKFFTAPRDFDLVLWVQGSDAIPYLEEGEKSSPETWQEFQRVFEGRFFGMAIWIN
jgi:hypothetical protein